MFDFDRQLCGISQEGVKMNGKYYMYFKHQITYMHQRNLSQLVQTMACHLFDSKSLAQAVLTFDLQLTLTYDSMWM